MRSEHLSHLEQAASEATELIVVRFTASREWQRQLRRQGETLEKEREKGREKRTSDSLLQSTVVCLFIGTKTGSWKVAARNGARGLIIPF